MARFIFLQNKEVTEKRLFHLLLSVIFSGGKRNSVKRSRFVKPQKLQNSGKTCWKRFSPGASGFPGPIPGNGTGNFNTDE